MKLSKLYSFVAAFALVLCAFVFASPPSPSFAATNIAVKTEKVAQNAFPVAIAFSGSERVVPNSAQELVRRKFYGYSISRSSGKFPFQPLNINAVGRMRPDYVPLN